MRAKSAKKHIIQPDSKFNSITIARIINRAMKSGKKTVIENQVYSALDLLNKKTGKDPIEVLDQALKNITPQMEVRSRRVGGAAYQVPIPVRTHRGSTLAIRWLVNEAAKRPNAQFHTYAEKLAAEILEATNEQGGAVQKKINAHKMADANKAFAHFRW